MNIFILCSLAVLFLSKFSSSKEPPLLWSLQEALEDDLSLDPAAAAALESDLSETLRVLHRPHQYKMHPSLKYPSSTSNLRSGGSRSFRDTIESINIRISNSKSKKGNNNQALLADGNNDEVAEILNSILQTTIPAVTPYVNFGKLFGNDKSD